MHIKILVPIIAINLFAIQILYPQGVSISDENGVEAHASAVLDIRSSSKGMLIPRLSRSEREAILNPAEGLMVYDSTMRRVYLYNKATNKWSPLAAGDVVWTYDTVNNVAYLNINPDLRTGIGTVSPTATLDIAGNMFAYHDIKAGKGISTNYKLLADGTLVPGLTRNPLHGWSAFPAFPPKSISIVETKSGHDSVSYIVAEPNQSGSDEPFFILFQEYIIDSIDIECWLYTEYGGIFFGLINWPEGLETPLWVAALTPYFEDGLLNSNNIFARFDIINQADTSFNAVPAGILPLFAWNHVRLAWEKNKFFKLWINGNQIASFPGSNIAPQALILGGTYELYVDAIGIAANGYRSWSNFGTGKMTAKVGVFDAIIAPNLYNATGYLPITGGTMIGNIQFKPRLQFLEKINTLFSRSRILLTSVDKHYNTKGKLELNSETSYRGNTPWHRESINAEGELEISSNSSRIGLAFDTLGFNRHWESRYRAEFASNKRSWGYGNSNDRAAMMIYINNTDTISRLNPITIIGFQRADTTNSDSILIAYNSPPENYNLWVGAFIKMTSGLLNRRTFNIQQVAVSTEGVWLIMASWASPEIQLLQPGDTFFVFFGNPHGISISSSYNTDPQGFVQSIQSTNDLYINPGRDFYLNTYNNNITIDGARIDFINGGLVMKREVDPFAVKMGIGTIDPHESLSISGGGIYLGQYNPSATYFKLYNKNGQLYWNGEQIITNINLANNRFSLHWWNVDRENIVQVQELQYGTDYIMAMKPVRFERKEGNGKKHFGLLTQDLETLFPLNSYGIVNKSESDNQLLIDYSEIIPILIKAVQELKQENIELRSQIRNLQSEMGAR